MNSTAELPPELRLICAIMETALTDKDIDYVMSESLEYHCELLSLDPEEVRNRFLREMKR